MRLFWEKLDYTFIRFVFVGIINTVFGVGLYCLFIYLGISYHLSVFFSTILGILFNFKTIGTFVFKNKNNRLLFRFVLSYVIVYFINIGIIHLFLSIISVGEYLAGIMATPIVAIISFFLQRRFVFISRKSS